MIENETPSKNCYPLFETKLREIGFANSRTMSISNAIGELHSALSYLDFGHMHEIKTIGLENLIQMFAKVEQLRNPYKGVN